MTMVPLKQHATLIIPRMKTAERGWEYLTLHFLQKKERPWRFAGGKVEAGEKPERTGQREAQEELAIWVEEKDLRLLKVISTRADGDLWVGHWFVVTKFTGTPQIGEMLKHDQIQWYTRAEIEALCPSAPEVEAVIAFERKQLTYQLFAELDCAFPNMDMEVDTEEMQSIIFEFFERNKLG